MQIRFGDVNDYYRALDILRQFNVPLQEATGLPSYPLSANRPMTAPNPFPVQMLPQGTLVHANYQQPFMNTMSNRPLLTGEPIVGSQPEIRELGVFTDMTIKEYMITVPESVPRPFTAPYRAPNEPPPKRDLDFKSAPILCAGPKGRTAGVSDGNASAKDADVSTKTVKSGAATVDSDGPFEIDAPTHSMPERPAVKAKPITPSAASQPQTRTKTGSRVNRSMKCDQCRAKRVKCVRMDGLMVPCEACSSKKRKCSFVRTATSNRASSLEESLMGQAEGSYVQVAASQKKETSQLQTSRRSGTAELDTEPTKTMKNKKREASEMSDLTGPSACKRRSASPAIKSSSMVLRSATATANASRPTESTTKSASSRKNTSIPRTPLRTIENNVQIPFTDATLTSDVADLDLDPKTPPGRRDGFHLPLSLTAPDDERSGATGIPDSSSIGMHDKGSRSLLDDLDLAELLNQSEDEQAITCNKMIAEILDDHKFLDLCRLLENNWRRSVIRW